MWQVHRIFDSEVASTANLNKNITKHESPPCGFGSAAGGGGALEPKS